ncbi:hypothetical protein BDCR2A_01613 [Borrelia duttonii CR2A]|uniref:Uncharacterized protein n=1 Tax=Borrelia duttonii CR2A TaxID=1432657 RepID=W6TJV1_9SPIR|nr:hypothetical protein BDCR2A_01613 [Borrelia duttonii CR2A]
MKKRIRPTTKVIDLIQGCINSKNNKLYYYEYN